MSLLRPVSREERRRRRRERRLKRIAMLPALFTVGNLLCGFAAISCCLLSVKADGADLAKLTLGSPHLERMLPTFLSIGGFLVFLGMACDAIDGRLARLTRRTSDFGGQLDSLADVITFGAAPALLVVCLILAMPAPHGWSPEMLALARRAAWVTAALYVACAALRLARFNVENVHDEAAHFWFKGLPSPGAAAAVASLVILHEHIVQTFPFLARGLVVALPPTAMAMGLLMVGRTRYGHLVNHYFGKPRPLWHLTVGLLVLLTMMLKPEWTIALLACGYALSGPVDRVRRRLLGHPPIAETVAHQSSAVPGKPVPEARSVPSEPIRRSNHVG